MLPTGSQGQGRSNYEDETNKNARDDETVAETYQSESAIT